MCRSRFYSALLAMCLISPLGAVAQQFDASQVAQMGLLQMEQAEELTSWETLQKSPVAFWRGMTRAEFDARVQADQDGRKVLPLGEFTFVAENASFDESDRLSGVSIEFRSDDPTVIEAAFMAYRRALGDIAPDFEAQADGTALVPDLQFAILGWRSPEGAESALARVHSYEAQRKNNNQTSAGVVSFAVRRF